jgi:excisionase family DNA binding protein
VGASRFFPISDDFSWLTILSAKGRGRITPCMNKGVSMQTNSPIQPLAYTLTDAAAVTGLSLRTIYNLIDDGKLTRIHVGRRALITAESLRALVQAEAA